MSSQSSKVEVLWSPNKDEEFAVYGTELRLYAVQELEVCSGNGGEGGGGGGRGRFLSCKIIVPQGSRKSKPAASGLPNG